MSFPKISPHTKHLDQSFADSEIILVTDHMPEVKSIQISYRGHDRYFQNTIIELFDTAGIDYQKKIFVFDSYMNFEDFALEQCVFTNEWFFESAVREFIDGLPSWNSIPDVKPTKNLTAMMNKVRPNRLILSSLLATLFDPSTINYSFRSPGYPPLLELQELLMNCGYSIDLSKLLPEKWYGPNEHISNVSTFSNFLYPNIFSSAAVSLVTEPTFFEKGTHITEKTLMSVYSGQFMIWVGSYKAAECAERMGLDIFSDIIDHSYQYIEHPGKRSVEAVLRNIVLLSNLELQTNLRNTLRDRLNNNLKLMRDLNKLNTIMRENFNSHNLDLYDYMKSYS